MHRRVIISTLAGSMCLWIPATSVLGQAPSNPGLAHELLGRRDNDQAVRDSLMKFFQSGRDPDSASIARMSAVDSSNTDWLKRVIAEYGWPGRNLVGADGSNAAFLMVQHSTDPAFLVSSLPLLENAVKNGEARAADYALLFDRVAIQGGRKQRFGTQARLVNGSMVFDPIEDSVHVDKRRADVGLSPLATYARQLDSLYTSRGKH